MTPQTRLILGLSCLLSLLFCASFVFFYQRYIQKAQVHRSQLENAGGKPLPEANLIDVHGGKLEDKLLRQGRCILVFVTPDCNACLTEGEFLKTIIDKQKKLPFYGVVAFGGRKAAFDTAKKKFPFDVFYDDGFKLAGALGITRVPIKIFVEDGVIIKAWGGATTGKEKQEEFLDWLKGL